jgi:hypothetical protein
MVNNIYLNKTNLIKIFFEKDPSSYKLQNTTVLLETYKYIYPYETFKKNNKKNTGYQNIKRKHNN